MNEESWAWICLAFQCGMLTAPRAAGHMGGGFSGLIALAEEVPVGDREAEPRGRTTRVGGPHTGLLAAILWKERAGREVSCILATKP